MAIYLDNNATTAIDPRVVEAIVEILHDGPANPASQHSLGRLARDHVDSAVETIGRCLGTRLDQPGGPRLVFTSGGTESNNLALAGIEPDGPLVISQIEHPSVIEPARAAQRSGRSVRWVKTDRDGEICLESLELAMDEAGEKPSLVSIMSANNETGVLQPIEQAARICEQRGVLLHVDATQSIGKLPIELDQLGAAAVTFSAHKFHGPPGIGALWLRSGVKIQPMLHGGQQQLETRPGTEPTAMIVAMARAVELASAEMDDAADRCRKLRDEFESTLYAQHPELVIHGANKQRLPATSCISFCGTDRQSMLMALDLAGISCSSGSACSSGSSPPSHVLLAMGCPEDQVRSAIRFGLSKFSTAEEIGSAIELISKHYNRLRRLSTVDN